MNTDSYSTQFRQYIINGLNYVLNRASLGPSVFSSADCEQALQLLDQALRLSGAWPQTRSALLGLSPLMEQAGYRDEWIVLLERGLRQGTEENDKSAVADVQYFLGILYERRGRYVDAETVFASAVQAFGELNVMEKQARALNRLAQLYRRQRRYDEAVAAVQQVFNLLPENDPERGYGHLVLSNAALDRRDWSAALSHAEQAYKLWDSKHDKRMMGWSLSLLGMVHRQTGQYDAAIKIYRQSIQLLAAVVDPINLALTQMNLGNVYLDLNEPAQALALYEQIEPVFNQAGEVLGLGNLYNNIGRAFHQQQRWSQAEAAFDKSLAFFRALGDEVEQANTLQHLNEIYKAQGKPGRVLYN